MKGKMKKIISLTLVIMMLMSTIPTNISNNTSIPILNNDVYAVDAPGSDAGAGSGRI